MQTLPPDNLTKFLAAWGAILATFGLGWTLYRDLHDRARLKISAHVQRLVQSTDGTWYAVKPDLPAEGASEKPYIVVSVTNIGRRPIQWTGWGGKYHKPVSGKSGFEVIPVALPKMLNEGVSHSEFTNLLIPASENVKRLSISDAAGKDWHLSGRALRKLKEEYRKFQKSEG